MLKPSPPWTMEKLYSMKPVPGAKKFGNHCFQQLLVLAGGSINAQSFRVHKNGKKGSRDPAGALRLSNTCFQWILLQLVLTGSCPGLETIHEQIITHVLSASMNQAPARPRSPSCVDPSAFPPGVWHWAGEGQGPLRARSPAAASSEMTRPHCTS